MATKNSEYPNLGPYTVVVVADLSLLAAPINKIAGDNRKGGDSSGKKPGQVVLADMGGGVFREVVALGGAANSKWQTVDGTTQYTPI